jgi:hypothetical protein
MRVSILNEGFNSPRGYTGRGGLRAGGKSRAKIQHANRNVTFFSEFVNQRALVAEPAGGRNFFKDLASKSRRMYDKV